MNLKKIKRELGPGTQVELTRDRKLKITQVKAFGLGYQIDERVFEDEKELAAHLKSKVPTVTIGPR